MMLSLCALANARESRVKVGIVDTGVTWTRELQPFLCESGHKDFTKTGIEDHIGHGSNITALITRGLDPNKVCVVILKWYDEANNNSPETLEAALSYAQHLHLQYINLSLSGPFMLPIKHWLLDGLLLLGTQEIIAAGNENSNLDENCNAFPACYPNTTRTEKHVVGSVSPDGKRSYFSNYGSVVTDWEHGEKVFAGGVVESGTSQATAIYTNKLIKMQRLWLRSK